MGIHDPLTVRTATLPLLFMLIVGPGCVHEPSWEKTFHTETVGKTTQRDVLEKLGEPQLRTALPGGGSLWVYEYSRGRINEELYECWEYSLKFDAHQVLREKEEINCAERTPYDPTADEQQFLKDSLHEK